MKNKKIIMYVTIIILILFIIGIGFLIINNNDNNTTINEFTPGEEITDEQLRKTNILLYFYDNNIKEIVAEIRLIDSKELLENPEKKLIEYLILGPNDNTLLRVIPENTKLINSELKDGILSINFSKDFINNQNLEKEIIIESLSKTVTQLNEIYKIKILIEGDEF